MSTPTLRSPFRDLERLFLETNRPVDGALATPLDVYRDGSDFIVQIDLPGFDPESIDVDVEDRTLTVRAERAAEEAREGFEWLVRERPSGSIARQLTLGATVATDRISASYDDGVLRITIPVAEEAKPRKITVERTTKPAEIAS